MVTLALGNVGVKSSVFVDDHLLTSRIIVILHYLDYKMSWQLYLKISKISPKQKIKIMA